MADAKQGSQAKLCMEPGAAAHTFNTSSEPYHFVRESMQMTQTVVDGSAIRGTRSHPKETVRAVRQECGGDIVLHANPQDLNLLLPRILGSAESSDSFTMAETLPAFGVLVDRVQQQFEYTDCVVNRAMFRARSGELVELTVNIWARTEVAGTSYPSLTLGTTDVQPYVMSEGVLTIIGTARGFHDFEVSIDNHLERRYANSLTATSITPTDRTVILRVSVPFDADDLVHTTAPGAQGGTLVFTNGNISTTFTFANLTNNYRSSVIGGKSEINSTLEYVARDSGATKALVVTHDSTS